MNNMRAPVFTQEEFSNIFSATMDSLCQLLSEQWQNFSFEPYRPTLLVAATGPNRAGLLHINVLFKYCFGVWYSGLPY